MMFFGTKWALANEKFVGGFASAWAVDKNGKKVPTHYTIEGNKLIQIVNHLSINAIYPIVADPYRGHDLIDYWEWDKIYDKNGRHYYHDWKLNVHTTVWQRIFGFDYYAGLQGWYELYGKAQNYGLTQNLTSMRNQYICHTMYAFLLPRAFHLEEWRLVVSWKATKDAWCNPAGHIDH